MDIILASASPRRRELMEQMGLRFRIVPSRAKEESTETEPELLVEHLSREKAEEVAGRLREDALYIGADTLVAVDGKVLGKPANEERAKEMLELLQGRTHQVYTGVTLLWSQKGKWEEKTFSEQTDVTFYPMTKEEIEQYVQTGEPMDKAGAYGIQGRSAVYIEKIEGDYHNVVGLPIGRLYQELKRKKIKACIFDLDGTLADTVESIAHAVNETLMYYGFSPRPVEEYNFYAGDGMNMAMKRALAAAGDPDGRYLEEAVPRVRQNFAKNPLYHAKLYEGVKDVLQELKRRGLSIAVFSNKPHMQAIEVVEALFGKDFFGAVQGQTNGIPRKPAPDGALAIAEKFHVLPQECMYFGDTNTDMDTGHAAGMYTVGVTWGFRPREELIAHDAATLIDTPYQILELLEEKE